MVLPKELTSDANASDDTATVVDGDDVRLTAQGRLLPMADDFGGTSGDDVEDGDGLADELIKARRACVVGVRSFGFLGGGDFDCSSGPRLC